MKLARLLVVAVALIGITPAHAAVTATNVMIYAPTRNQNRVVVVDPVTRSVVTSIPVGVAPYDAAFVPKTSSIYVANYSSDNVSVISTKVDDPRRNTVVATIDVGSRPVKIGYSAATNKIYVVNVISKTVTVIRASDNTVIKTIAGFAAFPGSIAVDDRIGRVFVGVMEAGTVHVVDTATDTIVQTFNPHPGLNPPAQVNDVAVAPGLSRLYLTDGRWGTAPPAPSFRMFTTKPGAGMALTGAFDLRASGGEIAVNGTESRAYITENSDAPGEADAGVNVVNLMTNIPITHIPVNHSSDVAVDPNGQVYIGTDNSNGVSIVSPVTNSVIATVPFVGDAYGLAVSYT